MFSRNYNNIQNVIEKCSLREGTELQWLIQNFDVIDSLPSSALCQRFGPLNGKVMIKLDLVKQIDGSYKLGFRAYPADYVVWAKITFKMHGAREELFSMTGNCTTLRSFKYRITHVLNIPTQKSLKFTFKPDVYMSKVTCIKRPVKSTSVERWQSLASYTLPFNEESCFASQSFNEWVESLPTCVRDVINQRVAGDPQWAESFENCAAELLQTQQKLALLFANNDLARQLPCMTQNILAALSSSYDCTKISEYVQKLSAKIQQQCKITEKAQQSSASVCNARASSQPKPEEQQQQRSSGTSGALPSEAKEQAKQLADGHSVSELEQQSSNQQSSKQPSPSAGSSSSGNLSLTFALVSEAMHSTSHALRALSGSLNASPTEGWTFLYEAKGVVQYVKKVQESPSKSVLRTGWPKIWRLPSGDILNVELIHVPSAEPQQQFVCELEPPTDMPFIYTLLDGLGQPIHKIELFSETETGFTADMLVKSAEIDDTIRIKIEAIPTFN